MGMRDVAVMVGADTTASKTPLQPLEVRKPGAISSPTKEAFSA